MEEVHELAIQKYYSVLVQRCNIDSLLPALVQKKVFSTGMIARYTNAAEDRLTRKRRLFIDIRRRGPEAFSNLIGALRETGQNYLADLLEPTSNGCTQPKRHAKPFMLPINEDAQQIQNIGNSVPLLSAHINLSSEPLRINVKPSAKLYDDPTQVVVPIYSTHSKNRGIVLIINNITYINNVHAPRQGAEIDGANLEELFLQMGLQVEMHVNKTGSQMEEIIIEFRSSLRINSVDMVFIIIMGHGEQKSGVTFIIGTDNKGIATAWVEEQFDNAHCKALQNRPKIIMYQTCRGLMPDYGVARHTQIDSAARRTVLRTCSDMLIAHSTLPGDASHRDIYLGSWYIGLFCEVMMHHAHDTDVEDVYKMVDSQLANLLSAKQTMQTSMYSNLGFKTCYIHPKIYMEDNVIKSIHDHS